MTGEPQSPPPWGSRASVAILGFLPASTLPSTESRDRWLQPWKPLMSSPPQNSRHPCAATVDTTLCRAFRGSRLTLLESKFPIYCRERFPLMEWSAGVSGGKSLYPPSVPILNTSKVLVRLCDASPHQILLRLFNPALRLKADSHDPHMRLSRKDLRRVAGRWCAIRSAQLPSSLNSGCQTGQCRPSRSGAKLRELSAP